MSADDSAQSGGVFDAHSDILYTVVREHGFGNRRVIEEQFLADMRTGESTCASRPSTWIPTKRERCRRGPFLWLQSNLRQRRGEGDDYYRL